MPMVRQMADRGSGDPFEGVQFGEDFVRGAAKRELSADERVHRASSAREAHEALLHQQAAEQPTGRRRRFTRSGRTSRWWNYRALIVVVILLGTVAWQQSRSGGGQSRGWLSGIPVVEQADGDRPTPVPASSNRPLGVPPPAAELDDRYEFLATQSDGSDPVTFDPCRPIRYTVNARTAPPGANRLLAEAMASISSATGLQFQPDGPTSETASTSRAAFQPDRYGDRWAPVLVAWSDPDELDRLDDEVAGLGGPNALQLSNGRRVNVTGSVSLDGPQLAKILERPGGWDQARSAIEHELAHLVGLNHVDDPSQLMNATGDPSITTYQAGDRAGLARLGSGNCVDLL
jgi:hypothetical protein